MVIKALWTLGGSMLKRVGLFVSVFTATFLLVGVAAKYESNHVKEKARISLINRYKKIDHLIINEINNTLSKGTAIKTWEAIRDIDPKGDEEFATFKENILELSIKENEILDSWTPYEPH